MQERNTSVNDAENIATVSPSYVLQVCSQGTYYVARCATGEHASSPWLP